MELLLKWVSLVFEGPVTSHSSTHKETLNPKMDCEKVVFNNSYKYDITLNH